MSNIFLYPLLNDTLFQKSEINVDKLIFSYKDDFLDKTNMLYSEFNDDEYVVVDPSGNWSLKDNNLIINCHVAINNPQVLFGKKGLVPQNTKIVIAIQLLSKSSLRRITKKCIEFDCKSNTIDQNFEIKINKGSFREEVKFKIVLSVGSISEATNEEKHLANHKGMMLGEIYCANIMLEGNGSEFPIVEDSLGSKEPLWTLTYDVEDPLRDKFSKEYVAIVLNKDHPDYKLLNIEDEKNISPLFREIFSNALSSILLRLSDDIDLSSLKDGTEYEEGTVCAAMKYIVESFNIDLSNVITITNSIKKVVDDLL